MRLFPLFAGLAWNPGIRGILVVAVGVAVLCGSVYLLLATNVGARLGMLLAFAGLTGWLCCLTLFWWISPPAIGPRGNSPTWRPVEIYVNGPDTPRTEVVAKLPQPDDLPSPDLILAQNPDLAKDFPNGFVLSELQSSHPELVTQYLEGTDLNGWRLVAGTAAGEAQASADGLLHERPRVRRPQRHDGVEVRDVPAFLQHVHVDHDLRGVVGALHVDQLLDRLVPLLPFESRVHCDDLALVAALEEGVVLDRFHQEVRVVRVPGDHEHERLHDGHADCSGVDLQLDLRVLVDANPILQLETLQPGLVVVADVEVLARRDGGFLDESVVHRVRKGVAVDHVLERVRTAAALDLRRGSEFQAENGLELIDSLHARRCPVAV